MAPAGRRRYAFQRLYERRGLAAVAIAALAFCVAGIFMFATADVGGVDCGSYARGVPPELAAERADVREACADARGRLELRTMVAAGIGLLALLAAWLFSMLAEDPDEAEESYRRRSWLR